MTDFCSPNRSPAIGENARRQLFFHPPHSLAVRTLPRFSYTLNAYLDKLHLNRHIYCHTFAWIHGFMYFSNNLLVYSMLQLYEFEEYLFKWQKGKCKVVSNMMTDF